MDLDFREEVNFLKRQLLLRWARKHGVKVSERVQDEADINLAADSPYNIIRALRTLEGFVNFEKAFKKANRELDEKRLLKLAELFSHMESVALDRPHPSSWVKTLHQQYHESYTDWIRDNQDTISLMLSEKLLRDRLTYTWEGRDHEKNPPRWDPGELKKPEDIRKAAKRIALQAQRDPRRVIVALSGNHPFKVEPFLMETPIKRLVMMVWPHRRDLVQVPIIFDGHSIDIRLEEPMSETQLDTMETLRRDGGVYTKISEAVAAAINI